MSRYEFDPVTHEPFHQEPPKSLQSATPSYAGGEAAAGAAPHRPPSLQEFDESAAAAVDRDASL